MLVGSIIAIFCATGVYWSFKWTRSAPQDDFKPRGEYKQHLLKVSVGKVRESRQALNRIKHQANPYGQEMLNTLESKTIFSFYEGVKKDEYLDFLDEFMLTDEEKSMLKQTHKASLTTSVTDLGCNSEFGAACVITRTHILSRHHSDEDGTEKIDLYIGWANLAFSIISLENMAEHDGDYRWWNPLSWSSSNGKVVQNHIVAGCHL